MQEHRLALKPGYQLDHFRIEAVLGKGGFGITYLALDLRLGKKVAIKELLPDSIATRVEAHTVMPQSNALDENWQWARQRFLEEARVLAGFSHPAIVGVHLLLEAHGTVYMVMDYVEGESYEARLRRIGREADEASLMFVMGPILDGLEEVHTKGLLHRDIKPENILINARGQPVLIDFGSARESVGKTMVMTSIVTHGYSPIEQYQTKGKMGPWTDIYAMGAVMCRAITGEKPPVAADRLMDDDFGWLSYRELAGFSEDFKRAVDWSLRVRPEERPQKVTLWCSHLACDDKTRPSWENHLPGRAETASEVPTLRAPNSNEFVDESLPHEPFAVRASGKRRGLEAALPSDSASPQKLEEKTNETSTGVLAARIVTAVFIAYIVIIAVVGVVGLDGGFSAKRPTRADNAGTASLRLPPDLPPVGFFTLEELFATGPYASYGPSSQRVALRAVQNALNRRGYYRARADGKVGPATQEAIIALQRSLGLRPTGRLDAQTLEKLEVRPP
jgi:serine/threonine protein kinase